MLGFDVYLSWSKSSALPDTETLGDAVEATLYNVFNSSANYTFMVMFCTTVIWQSTKAHWLLAARTGLQLIHTVMTFDYNA